MKSYTHQHLEAFADEIRSAVKCTGARMRGPVRLPTRLKKFTVNRSPHVDKKSREQFEIRTHSRLIIVEQLSAPTLDALTRIETPPSVGFDVKVKGELAAWSHAETMSPQFAAAASISRPGAAAKATELEDA